MATTLGADEARTRLPELLERAHNGHTALITKRGRPYAALVPVPAPRVRTPILALAGSGAGLWIGDAAIASLRDEWA